MDESQIIFEDANIIVLNKAPGLLSQGDKSGDENLVDWLRVYLGRNYVGLVHRLDRNTSGAIVVAKRTKAARRLTECLQKKELKRHYLALVEGETPEKQILRNHLLKNSENNKMRIVSAQTPKAQEAFLEFQTMQKLKHQAQYLSLLKVQLKTGRSHQIRIQLSHFGHPLLGDRKYASRTPFPRVALHSHQLQFPHPISKEILTFECPLPRDFHDFMKACTSELS